MKPIPQKSTVIQFIKYLILRETFLDADSVYTFVNMSLDNGLIEDSHSLSYAEWTNFPLAHIQKKCMAIFEHCTFIFTERLRLRKLKLFKKYHVNESLKDLMLDQ